MSNAQPQISGEHHHTAWICPGCSANFPNPQNMFDHQTKNKKCENSRFEQPLGWQGVELDGPSISKNTNRG